MILVADFGGVLVPCYEKGFVRVLALEYNIRAQVPVHKAHLMQVTDCQKKAFHLPRHHLLAPVILKQVSEAHVSIACQIVEGEVAHQGSLKAVEEGTLYLAADQVHLEVIVEPLHGFLISSHIS